MSSSILLGVIQGITEFLPISSDGHLALAQLVLGLEQGGLTLNVMLHAGSLPTAVIGLLLRDAVERWTHSSVVIGLGFLGTAAVLLSTRFVRVGDREVPSLVGALVIGVLQGLAVLPGLSRSGSTIAAALWFKVRPDRAFELSMLMSLPAVAGAIGLEARHLGGASEMLLPAAIGATVALVVGVAALLVLRRVVMRGHFSWFAAWVLPLALVTLGFVRDAPPAPAPAAVSSASNRDS